MKHLRWPVIFGILLIISSVLFYVVQIYIFKTPRDTFFYLFQDLAFVPVQVLLVTLILNGLLSVREKRVRFEKLNMVIGAFFSEMGTRLVAFFSSNDPKADMIRTDLIVTNAWSDKEFITVSRRLKAYDYGVDINRINLEQLNSFLVKERDFLIRLFENPYLLEHTAFTDMLRAVLHLTEELEARTDFAHLPEADLKHLSLDIKRAYILLVNQWLDYMKHLKDNYPYLFSLAMRTNPFDASASPVILS